MSVKDFTMKVILGFVWTHTWWNVA